LEKLSARAASVEFQATAAEEARSHPGSPNWYQFSFAWMGIFFHAYLASLRLCERFNEGFLRLGVRINLLTNTMMYRILYRMKITAIIEDDLVNSVKAFTRSPTVTGAITIALKDWLDIHHIKELNTELARNPIQIGNGQKMRELNRQK
jgi:hypothetical protein